MSCRDVGPSWLAACLGVVLLAGGCERPTTLVPVKGRVLLDGKPLPSGVVQFQPASGQSASDEPLTTAACTPAAARSAKIPARWGASTASCR